MPYSAPVSETQTGQGGGMVQPNKSQTFKLQLSKHTIYINSNYLQCFVFSFRHGDECGVISSFSRVPLSHTAHITPTRTRTKTKRQKRPLRPNRTKPSSQASKYERVDPQEHATQQLERAYTAKTEQAAAAKSTGPKGKGKRGIEAAGEGAGAVGGGDAERKKGGEGRWFDWQGADCF